MGWLWIVGGVLGVGLVGWAIETLSRIADGLGKIAADVDRICWRFTLTFVRQ